MFLAATCPDCGKRLKYRQDSAGRRIRCPACRATLIALSRRDVVRANDVVPGDSGHRISSALAEHLVIGRNFTIGKGELKGKHYIGPIVASRDALYLLPTMSESLAGLGVLGGAVAGAVAALVAATIGRRTSYPLGMTFE